MTFRQERGRLGEDKACDFLKSRGFTVIERNFWRKWGEIDVVARRGTELRFVEVKTVTREGIKDDDYEPEDNIHPWKRKRLRRAIETWLLAHEEFDDLDWQVDVISVYLNLAGETLKVEWLEDILL